MSPWNGAAVKTILNASEEVEGPKDPHQRKGLSHLWMVHNVLLWPRALVHSQASPAVPLALPTVGCVACLADCGICHAIACSVCKLRVCSMPKLLRRTWCTVLAMWRRLSIAMLALPGWRRVLVITVVTVSNQKRGALLLRRCHSQEATVYGTTRQRQHSTGQHKHRCQYPCRHRWHSPH